MMEHYKISLDPSTPMDSIGPSENFSLETLPDSTVLPAINFETDEDYVIYTCLSGTDTGGNLNLQCSNSSKEASIFDDIPSSTKLQNSYDLSLFTPSTSRDITSEEFGECIVESFGDPVFIEYKKENQEIIGGCSPGSSKRRLSSSSKKIKNSDRRKGKKQEFGSFEESKSVCKKETPKIEFAEECVSESLKVPESSFVNQLSPTSVQKRKQTPEEKRELKKQRAQIWRQRKRLDDQQKQALIDNLRAKIDALEREKDTRDFITELSEKDKLIGELKRNNEALKNELEALKLKLDKVEENQTSQPDKSSDCDMIDLLNGMDFDILEESKPVTKVEMIKLFSALIDAKGDRKVFHQLVDS